MKMFNWGQIKTPKKANQKKYRYLKVGERINVGDDLMFADGSIQKVEVLRGKFFLASFIGRKRIESDVPIRREVDLYFRACSEMEHWQAKRAKEGKEIGTEGSLCDGIAWLFARIEKLESKFEDSLAVHDPAAWTWDKPKLIGWRTSDYLRETSDIDKAKNWEDYYEILPIFEGDPNTRLASPQPSQQQWVWLTKDEIDVLMTQAWGDSSIAPKSASVFAQLLQAELKEKNR